MKNLELYKTSKDYRQLYYYVIAGLDIIAFIKFDSSTGEIPDLKRHDICRVTLSNSEIEFLIRGMCYLSMDKDIPMPEFEKLCEFYDVKYVRFKDLYETHYYYFSLIKKGKRVKCHMRHPKKSYPLTGELFEVYIANEEIQFWQINKGKPEFISKLPGNTTKEEFLEYCRLMGVSWFEYRG